MNMDGKIAHVQWATRAVSADWWVKISTLEPGKPVNIPLLCTTQIARALERHHGVEANFCQVTVTKPDHHGTVAVRYKVVVKSERAPARAGTQAVAVDWGLTTMVSTSDGDVLGQGFHARLLRVIQMTAENGELRS
jgi:putative transposase